MQGLNRVVCQSMMRETVWDGAEGGSGEQIIGTLCVAEEFAKTDQFMSKSSSGCSQLTCEKSPASALTPYLTPAFRLRPPDLHLPLGGDPCLSITTSSLPRKMVRQGQRHLRCEGAAETGLDLLPEAR